MADNKEEIVERLKQEGMLVRNSGTNSIKSVKQTLNINHDKLQSVYDTITDTMNVQTEILGSMLKLQQERFQIDVENIKDQARREKFDKLKNKREKGNRKVTPKSRGVPSKAQGFGLGFFQEFLGSLFSGILVTGGALASTLAANATRYLLRGGFVLLLAPLIGDFVEKLTTQAVESLPVNLTGAQKTSFVGAIGNGVQWGLIGGIFGKKLGLWMGATGFMYSYIEEALENSEGEILSRLKEEFGSENLATLASVVVSAFGFATMRKALRGSLFGSGGTEEDSEGKSRFRDKFKGAVRPGIFGLMGLVGLMSGSAITAYAGDGTNMNSGLAGDISGIASAALAGGMLFGVKGALIGAIVGLAAAGISRIADWLDANQEKFLENVIEDADQATQGAQEAMQSGEYDVAARKALSAANRVYEELERNSELATGGVMNEELATSLGNASSILETILADDKMSSDVSPNVLKNMADRILSLSNLETEDWQKYVDRMVQIRQLQNPDLSESQILESLQVPGVISKVFGPRRAGEEYRELIDIIQPAIESLRAIDQQRALEDARARYIELTKRVIDMSFDENNQLIEFNRSERRKINDLESERNALLERFGKDFYREGAGDLYNRSNVRGGDTYNNSSSTKVFNTSPHSTVDPSAVGAR